MASVTGAGRWEQNRAPVSLLLPKPEDLFDMSSISSEWVWGR